MGFVNEVVKSDYAFPSGGVGRSGYGRECGNEGYKQFANVKVHYINWNRICLFIFLLILLRTYFFLTRKQNFQINVFMKW